LAQCRSQPAKRAADCSLAALAPGPGRIAPRTVVSGRAQCRSPQLGRHDHSRERRLHAQRGWGCGRPSVAPSRGFKRNELRRYRSTASLTWGLHHQATSCRRCRGSHRAAVRPGLAREPRATKLNTPHPPDVPGQPQLFTTPVPPCGTRGRIVLRTEQTGLAVLYGKKHRPRLSLFRKLRRLIAAYLKTNVTASPWSRSTCWLRRNEQPRSYVLAVQGKVTVAGAGPAAGRAAPLGGKGLTIPQAVLIRPVALGFPRGLVSSALHLLGSEVARSVRNRRRRYMTS